MREAKKACSKAGRCVWYVAGLRGMRGGGSGNSRTSVLSLHRCELRASSNCSSQDSETYAADASALRLRRP